MRPRLLNLLANNAKRGAFRAEGDTILLYDVVVGSEEEAAWFGGVSPEAFRTQLQAMRGTVHLRINSPGGDVFGAVAIAQAMREYEGEIIAHVDGLAASAASTIAVAASRTIMAPGSFLMIHKAWTIMLGNSDEFLAEAALLEKIDGSIAQGYAAKSGQPVEGFAAAMQAETWYTAEEAVAAGLADEIAAARPSAGAPAAKWDLSAFAAPPKNDTVTVSVTVTVEDDDDAEQDPADPAEAGETEQQNAERRARIHAVRMLAPTA